LNISPEAQQELIQTVSKKLINNIIYNGLIQVCTHPIGLKCVKENIKNVSVKYDYLATTPDQAVATIDGSTLQVLVSKTALSHALTDRFKERIELKYDVIVAIAEDNAKALHNSTTQTLKEATGQDVPYGYHLKSFTDETRFKAFAPAQQADVVTNVVSRLPEHLTQAIAKIVKFPIGMNFYI
jgi:hypothetical protein